MLGLLRFVNLRRTLAAGVLLAGLFSLLFFVLLPEGEDGRGGRPVTSARLASTRGDGSQEVGTRPGRLAQDFEASNLDGERFRLSDLRGRPLVINFWATWCTSCLAEMPVLEEQRRAHVEDGLAIVAVNVGEGAGDAREFIDALQLREFFVAMDPDLTIADAYGVRGLPQSVFVDRNGVVQATYLGQLDDETMDRYVRAALDATPGGEPPRRLRFVTTVPREHTLEVYPDDSNLGRVRFVSRRFRCDDAYCARALVEGLRQMAGIADLELRTEATPAELVITFDPSRLSLATVVGAVADALRAQPDPLYTRELEVRYPLGER